MTENQTSIIDRPFSDNIVKFLKSFFPEIKKTRIFFSILRNYENLPDYCGFDLDFITDKENFGKIKDIILKSSKSEGLECVIRDNHNGYMKVLIFDVSLNTNKRLWLLLDIQSKIAFPEFANLYNKGNPELSFCNINGMEIPVLNPDMEFFAAFTDSIRKNNLSQKKDKLLSLLEKINIDSPVFNILSSSHDEIKKIISTGTVPDAYIKSINIKKQIPASNSKKGGYSLIKIFFSKFCFYKLFFIHIHKPFFFVLQGPDGVGKTTTGNLITEIFSQYPVPFSFFHHISEWKYSENDILNADKSGGNNSDVEPEKIPVPRRILKFIWKFVPPYMKHVWGISISELSYAYNVNKLIGERFFQGQAVLADRYVYDRYMKMYLHPLKSKTQKFFSLLSTILMRKPLLAITLIDEPHSIYKRKQELTSDEIAEYQNKILSMCTKRNIANNTVSIDGQSPEIIAKKLATHILHKFDKYIFSLVGLWEKEYRK